jgi:hypothetical protein
MIIIQEKSKMIMRNIASVSVLLCALTLTACGDCEEGEDTAATETEETTEETTEDTTEESTEETEETGGTTGTTEPEDTGAVDTGAVDTGAE